MQLRQLEYFIVTAEALNISVAASKLYISQQALSEQIRKLEQEYNTQFFIRGKKIALTYAGECMLKMARQTLALERNLRNELATLSDQVVGDLSVGMSFPRSRNLFPRILSNFRQLYPLVNVQLFTGSTESLKSDIVSGKTDIVIAYDQFFSRDIVTEPLGTERLFLVVPRRYLLQIYGDRTDTLIPQLRQRCSIRPFAEQPFLMLYHTNYIGEHVNRLFAENMITPKVAFEGNDLDLLCSLSRNGLGLTFLPELMIAAQSHIFAENGENTLYAFPLEEDYLRLPLVVGYNRNQFYTELSKEFCRCCIETYRDLLQNL